MSARLTVGDGFRVAFGFFLFQVVLAIVIFVPLVALGLMGAA